MKFGVVLALLIAGPIALAVLVAIGRWLGGKVRLRRAR
jgi:hypothetical protein